MARANLRSRSIARPSLLLVILISFLFALAGRGSQPLSVCPLRDPGPDAGWVRVPQEYDSVGEAVEAAVSKGLNKVWVGPGVHPAVGLSRTHRGIYIEQSLILCGMGRDLTVIKWNEEESYSVITIRNYTEVIEVIIEGLTITGGDAGLKAFGKAKVTIQNSRFFGNKGGPYGGAIELYLYGGQATIYNIQVIANYTGLTILGESQAVISNSQFSANEYEGMLISGRAKVTINRTRISGNNSSGIMTDYSPQITISNSEISYNGASGIYLVSRAQLEANDNRILGNRGYGILLLEPPCFEKDVFDGEVHGKGNEIRDNAKGDLCPADYPWPAGFKK